jgi:hypothetical protein
MYNAGSSISIGREKISLNSKLQVVLAVRFINIIMHLDMMYVYMRNNIFEL